MIAVEKLATWIPVTQEMLDDAEPMRRILRNTMEYSPRPLTEEERLTGWQSFTDSTGYTLRHKVGWRAALSQALRSFAAEAWPEDFADDD